MKIKIDFQKEKLGDNTEKQIKKSWKNPKIVTTSVNPQIVKDGNKKVLEIGFSKGKFGKEDKASWHIDLKKEYEILYCQYRVKFEKGFDWALGGKLPGFAGGDKPGGGRHSLDGFSSRVMWPGKWHTIKMKIKMNKNWEDPGYIICWLDGKLALHQEVKWRQKGAKYGIRWFMFTLFFGGNDESFAPKRDSKIYFDDFVISDKEIN